MPPPSVNKSANHPAFIFIGGHPAIDYANTRVLAEGNPQELFLSWPDVVDWLLQAELTTGEGLQLPAAAGTRALKSIIELRETWEQVLSELVSGKQVSDSFLDHLNAYLSPGMFHEILHREGKRRFRIHHSASPLRGEKLALHLIARQIAHFLAEANLSYLHRCANTASCVLYFYDTTKNHRRQWCSVATCGNRHKVAQFRKRQTKRDK